MSESTPASTQPARSCGSCTMCCKVYEVPPIDNKPRSVWCKHCSPGKGCGIWQERPQFCRDFHCQWIRDESFGDDWRPDKSKLVMNFREDLGVLTVMVDPSTPGAWRKEPYLSVLQKVAAKLAQKQNIVQIVVHKTVIVLGAEKEIPIGEYEGQLDLTWSTTPHPTGTIYALIGARPLKQQ